MKVLPPAEQTVFRRMIKKLGAGTKICRDTLVLSSEAWRHHTLPRNPWPLPRWQCSLFPGLAFA